MGTLLHEKVAIVTGASSGIGAATARALGREGVRVVLAARNAAALDDVADSVREHGSPALAVTCNLANEVEVVSLVGRTLDAFGGIDILVNAAGTGTFAEIAEGSTADWRAMLDVNVLGLTLLTREVIAVMMEAHRGDVVNVACHPGHGPVPAAFYDATKAFVATFSSRLRREARPHGIRVMTVTPGTMAGGLGTGTPGLEEHRSAVEAVHPEDVAEAILHVVTRPRRVTCTTVELMPTLEED